MNDDRAINDTYCNNDKLLAKWQIIYRNKFISWVQSRDIGKNGHLKLTSIALNDACMFVSSSGEQPDHIFMYTLRVYKKYFIQFIDMFNGKIFQQQHQQIKKADTIIMR